MRHKWNKVRWDMRYSVLDVPRPLIHQCVFCRVFRVTVGRYEGETYRSYYGFVFDEGPWYKRAPSCEPEKTP